MKKKNQGESVTEGGPYILMEGKEEIFVSPKRTPPKQMNLRGSETIGGITLSFDDSSEEEKKQPPEKNE